MTKSSAADGRFRISTLADFDGAEVAPDVAAVEHCTTRGEPWLTYTIRRSSRAPARSRPLIESEAARAEADTTTTPSGRRRGRAPPSCSGSSCRRSWAARKPRIDDALEVFEELAYADGSTGWSVMANVTTSCFAAIYTERRRVGRRCSPPTRSASTPACSARSARRAAVDGGFVVIGQLPVRQRLRARDVVRRGRAGGRRRRRAADRRRRACRRCASCSCAPSRSRCAATGTCSASPAPAATTTRSTSSSSRPGFSFPLLAADARSAAAPATASACSASSPPATPASRSASASARSTRCSRSRRRKQRMGGSRRSPTEQLFQHDFAMHDAAMRAARAYVFESFADAEATVLAGDALLARAAAAHAPGDDVRDARRGRRGPVRVHVGGHDGAAQRRSAAALLPRHPRGHAAPLRRQQHAHRVHAGPARGTGLDARSAGCSMSSSTSPSGPAKQTKRSSGSPGPIAIAVGRRERRDTEPAELGVRRVEIGDQQRGAPHPDGVGGPRRRRAPMRGVVKPTSMTLSSLFVGASIITSSIATGPSMRRCVPSSFVLGNRATSRKPSDR